MDPLQHIEVLQGAFADALGRLGRGAPAALKRHAQRELRPHALPPRRLRDALQVAHVDQAARECHGRPRRDVQLTHLRIDPPQLGDRLSQAVADRHE